MIFDWPATLIPNDVIIRPPRKTTGLNRSLSGFGQAVPVIRPPFGLKLVFGEIWGSEVLAWRAMEALFEGRANVVRVPLFDLWLRAGDAAIGAGAVTHSDGTSFSDGALYVTDDLVGVTVSGVQGQRRITVDFGTYGKVLQAGLFFGIGEHPYLARRVWWEGSVATIDCQPTLRRAVTDAAIKLRPTMLAGLTSDDGAELALTRARFGTPTIELEERFNEPLS
ncbi:MAG: hypothetical protein ACOY45_09655 [Pseudomonadota bacterium]